jgi:polysaccharide chain length determinant protein (PEP-CTERM system associated)
MFYQRSFVFRMLDAFFRHRIIFLVSSLTVITLISVFVLLKPKSYEGGYTIILDNHTLTNPLGASSQSSGDDVDTSVNHLQSLISTQQFIADSLKNPDGSDVILHYPININDGEQLSDLRKSITVTATADDAFSLSIQYKDPDDAKKLLNGIITSFITQTAQEKSAFFSADVAFIQQQVDTYRQKLSDAETALTNFKAKNSTNLPSEQQAIEQQMVTYQSQAQDLAIEQTSDQQRAKYLQSQLALVPQQIVTAQTDTDSPLVTQLKNLEVQLTTDVVVKQMKPTHPEVIALQQQIDRLKQDIEIKRKTGDAEYKGPMSTDTEPNPLYQSLQSQVVQTEIDERASQAKLTATMQLLAKATAGAALVPGAERTLTNLERDYSTYSTNYDNLMNRLQEAQINEQLNLRQAQNAYDVLLTAPPTSSQSRSKIAELLLGGVVLALLIAFTLVLLAELLDQSLRDPLETQRLLDLPVLAILPDAPVLNSFDAAGARLLTNYQDDQDGPPKALVG